MNQQCYVSSYWTVAEQDVENGFVSGEQLIIFADVEVKVKYLISTETKEVVFVITISYYILFSHLNFVWQLMTSL